MAEIGLDISGEFPKQLTTGKVQAADVVITMGCGDACPVFPGKRYLGLANAVRQRAGRRSQPSRTAGPPALGITQP
jgi:protein-tyrosine-phosphatase